LVAFCKPTVFYGSYSYDTFFQKCNNANKNNTTLTYYEILQIKGDTFSEKGASIDILEEIFILSQTLVKNKVRFTPTSSCSKTATVSFANENTNENPYSFTITKVGHRYHARIYLFSIMLKSVGRHTHVLSYPFILRLSSVEVPASFSIATPFFYYDRI